MNWSLGGHQILKYSCLKRPKQLVLSWQLLTLRSTYVRCFALSKALILTSRHLYKSQISKISHNKQMDKLNSTIDTKRALRCAVGIYTFRFLVFQRPGLEPQLQPRRKDVWSGAGRAPAAWTCAAEPHSKDSCSCPELEPKLLNLQPCLPMKYQCGSGPSHGHSQDIRLRSEAVLVRLQMAFDL